MEHRYNEEAQKLEDDLKADLTPAEEDPDEKDEDVKQSGLERIAEKKTPLDEVKAIIDASRARAVQPALNENAARNKMSSLVARGRDAVLEFLKAK